MQAYRATGDYHLLVPGGIYEQPAGEWLARNYAAYVWQLMEKLENKSGGDLPKLTPDEYELHEEIAEIEADIDLEMKADKVRRDAVKRVESERKRIEVERKQKARNRA